MYARLSALRQPCTTGQAGAGQKLSPLSRKSSPSMHLRVRLSSMASRRSASAQPLMRRASRQYSSDARSAFVMKPRSSALSSGASPAPAAHPAPDFLKALQGVFGLVEHSYHPAILCREGLAVACSGPFLLPG